MIHLVCPICQNPLKRLDSQYSCGAHSFDLAKSGYINLLPSNKKRSQSPGDNKEMLMARRNVLDQGYYKALSEKLQKIMSEYNPKTILDLGCGEGTLTKSFSSISEQCFGIDISKEGILRASKQDHNTLYIVASANKLPFPNNSIDVLISCFAPLNEKEVRRVLNSNGILIKVTPSPEHLIELKERVYPEVYLNPKAEEISGFTTKDSFVVSETKVYSEELARDIFTMTPYHYKTPKEYIEKINSPMKITTSFTIRVLTPKKQ